MKVDFDNYKIEMFKKHNEDGIFIVTPGGYEEINYNPVEQEGEEITELFITGTPTIINSGSNLKIVENNMDDAHMIHKAEKGLFAFDPPDEENQFSIGKYKPSRINEFVTLHTPDLQDGFYVIFPEIYSKYAMDDAFFFRIKK